jgi:hypothetical protein
MNRRWHLSQWVDILVVRQLAHAIAIVLALCLLKTLSA